MEAIFKGGKVYGDGVFSLRDVAVSSSLISPADSLGTSIPVFNCKPYIVVPGLVDVHVHLREPGFSYKERILTGTAAAAHGGYTSVCSMPNLNPAPDCPENLAVQQEIIDRDACIRVYPYGTITRDEKGETLADMAALAPNVIAFSDDGHGVQSDAMMEKAMETAKSLGKMIVAHCEVNDLLRGGYIHDGEYCAQHGHKGICSESEWKQIERDLKLAEKTGCAYHVCHISTKESVQIIGDAKKSGIDVTCETGPHYLIMDDSMLQEEGRFKMNPPLRSRADRDALVQGIIDGTIDMIATDHAPHTLEEKSRGLAGSPMGITGIETAFPLLYTYLVKKNIISLPRLMELMHDNPAKRFGIGGNIENGANADFAIFDLEDEYVIDPADFLSMGKSTPFTGWKVAGRCLMTVCGGKIVYNSGKVKEI